MAKLSKEDIARAIYDLNNRVSDLEKKVDITINKFTLSYDLLDKKIKELEGLLSVLDEDYYSIKKETTETLKFIEPFKDTFKDYPRFKEIILDELTKLSESLEKVSEILREHNKRLKKLENLKSHILQNIV